MAIQFDANVNSAILSGAFGLQKASDGIAKHSFSIAQQQAKLRDPQELMADAARQQIGLSSQLLPTGGDSLTSDLVGLSLNLRNAEASAKVLDVAKDTIGTIIDEVA